MELNLKEKLGKIFAYLVHLKNKKWIKNPIRYQTKTFFYILRKAKNTSFGIDHSFKNIKTYDWTSQRSTGSQTILKGHSQKHYFA